MAVHVYTFQTKKVPYPLHTFADIVLIENQKVLLVVQKQDKVLDVVDGRPYRSLFRIRKRLKAVIVQQGEKTTWQIVRWVDLHRHSGYSLLDGGSRISDMVQKTEYAGAITDHGAMFGVLEYYKRMKAANKLPILGMEAYSETIDGKKEEHHLLLLVRNEEGFRNLMKLTSLSYENFYRKPHVSYEMLARYGEGLIATTSCLGGEIPQLLMKGDYEQAKLIAKTMIEIFGKEHYYVELQRHGIEEEHLVNPQLMELAKELGVKVVATIDSHYTNQEDAYAHEVLLCIGTGKTIYDTKRMKLPGEGYHIHTPEEAEERFRDLPEALDAGLEIAEKCSGWELDLTKRYMPHTEIPSSFTHEDAYFEHLCWEGFDERFGGKEEHQSPVYRERLSYEIKTIQQMGFSGYFLIVWDLIRHAKEKGIAVGPGRGSVVGSLAAYCLGITSLDPIPYGLLFERFLNPERVSMPDIDIDFQDDRRDEMVEYVKEKYGDHAVSRIITFGSLHARSVVRDVARVLNVSYAFADKIAKSIPEKETLAQALESSVELRKMYEEHDVVRQIVDVAKRLEGLPRHASQHACGVVIAPAAVREFVPELLMTNEETKAKERTTQMTMTEVEELGLLKMDFLGLRTMTVIQKTLEMVNEKRKQEGLPPLKYTDIPLNDKKVYQDIAKGDTYAVFQLESKGMRMFMKELFADVEQVQEGNFELFERLIAGVALYRPGPMDAIPDYLNSMRNPASIQYDHPLLRPILQNTYGQIVYQEQVMQIVRDLAGYSLGRSDLIRRAMGKKKVEVMEKEKKHFIEGIVREDGTVEVEGCLRRGIPRDVAERIWDKMEDFAKYAFNKSHAAAYAMIGYITAWLKYYYPLEYMTSVLNSVLSDSEKLKEYLHVCKKMNIQVLPPNVNRSDVFFSVENGAIRFGLMGIRNVGKAAERIVEERKRHGQFHDLFSFSSRMAKYETIDKKVLESLIYSGATDELGGTRKEKINILESLLKELEFVKRESRQGQITLFDYAEEVGDDTFSAVKQVTLTPLGEFEEKEKLEKEREYVGFYLSRHPLDRYKDQFGIHQIRLPSEWEEASNQDATIAGVVQESRLCYSKKGTPYLTFLLEDEVTSMRCLVFEKHLESVQPFIHDGNLVVVHGNVKSDDFGVSMQVRHVSLLDSFVEKGKPKSVWVKTNVERIAREVFALSKQKTGDIPLYVVYRGRTYRSKHDIRLNLDTLEQLEKLCGKWVKVVYS